MPKERKAIAILATLDTKGQEASYLCERLLAVGTRPVVVDLGLTPARGCSAGVTRGQVARAAGEGIRGFVERLGREEALQVMARGGRRLLERMAAKGELDGVVALGGSVGTGMAVEASAGLPLGLPKVLVTTLPPGASAQGQGAADLVLVHCPVDLVGLNVVTRRTLAQAAAAVVGMATVRSGANAKANVAPIIGLTCLGVVTPGVKHLRAMLERHGYEAVVFHGVTNLDELMRRLGSSLQVAGEVRVAAMDIMMELQSGRASPRDLPGDYPVVYAPGALDMLIMRTEQASGPRFAGRRRIDHSPLLTLMRTTGDEARELARILARKIKRLGSRAAVVVPLRGFSMHGAPGQRFSEPTVDGAFLEELRRQLPQGPRPVEVDANINDRAFARVLARELLSLSGRGPRGAAPRYAVRQPGS